jgi:hypothetical protein
MTYGKRRLFPYRKEKLNKIGFVWKMRDGPSGLSSFSSQCITANSEPRLDFAIAFASGGLARPSIISIPLQKIGNELHPLNYIGSQRCSRWSYSVIAVIQIVELKLGFPMVQFCQKNI